MIVKNKDCGKGLGTLQTKWNIIHQKKKYDILKDNALIYNMYKSYRLPADCKNLIW